MKALGVTFYEDGYSQIEARRFEGKIDNAVLRAYDRMVMKGVIDEEFTPLPDEEIEKFYSYDVRDLFDGDFTRVLCYYDDVTPEYFYSGNELRLYRERHDELYAAFIPRLDLKKEDLEIPDSLARLIPYFVKSELLEEEEPSRAAMARNLFEESLDEFVATYHTNVRQKLKYRYQ